ncbi:MAG: colanic acid biosynthesis glycosyltransferase WcaL, partial [Bacteroidetes bacterium]|nr:colanic acid biosynthesis glycosyltransferase WcaL [Bacteroidota bacterium]
MRIAHLCNSFSALSETFIYDTVTELERQGEDNHVITLKRVNTDTRPFDKVHEVPLTWKWHPRRLWHRLGAAFSDVDAYASYWPQLRPRLEAVLRALLPDVIHAHFGPMGVIVRPIA